MLVRLFIRSYHPTRLALYPIINSVLYNYETHTRVYNTQSSASLLDRDIGRYVIISYDDFEHFKMMVWTVWKTVLVIRVLFWGAGHKRDHPEFDLEAEKVASAV